MSLFDRFENRFGHLAIPRLLKIIALYQLLVWVLLLFNPEFVRFLALDPPAVLRGQVWRLFTFVFIPRSADPIFILFATWFLIWLGAGLENAWGAFRVNVYFLVAMLGLIVAAFISPSAFTGGIGPEDSLLYTTMFLAFATLFPNEQILLFFIIPVKVKWLGWVAALGLLVMFARFPEVRLAIILSHLNYLLFFGPGLWGAARHRGRVEMRRRRFESQMPDVREAFHRCHACGKTDQSDPHTEFRVAADGEEYCRGCLPASAGKTV